MFVVKTHVRLHKHPNQTRLSKKNPEKQQQQKKEANTDDDWQGFGTKKQRRRKTVWLGSWCQCWWRDSLGKTCLLTLSVVLLLKAATLANSNWLKREIHKFEFLFHWNQAEKLILPLNIAAHALVNLAPFVVFIYSAAVKIISTSSSKRGNRAVYVFLYLSMRSCDEMKGQRVRGWPPLCQDKTPRQLGHAPDPVWPRVQDEQW